MSGKNSQRAKVHARRAYQCSHCGKIVYGNGGRASHRYMHEKRGEIVTVPPYAGTFHYGVPNPKADDA